MPEEFATIETLRDEYSQLRQRLDKFAIEFGRQLTELLEQDTIALGVPVQSRVKEWDSIQAKLERKQRALSHITDLTDSIGLRVITLFQKDVDAVCEVITKHFGILEQENTQGRLEESQFGYLSVHFIIQCQPEWYATPIFAPFRDLNIKIEIQVRSLAQHIWATASHILQYKQEETIPVPIRRTLYRLSALLEIIDLEFTRLLEQKATYQGEINMLIADEEISRLDVDTLAKVLSDILPSENKDAEELYADLLEDLTHFGITNPNQLQGLVLKHRDAILRYDAESVQAIKEDQELQQLLAEDKERFARGVFFTYVGLVRVVMAYEFEQQWSDYWDQKQPDDVDSTNNE